MAPNITGLKKIIAALLILLSAGCFKDANLIQPGEKAVLWESFEQSSGWRAARNSWGDQDSSLLARRNSDFSTDGKASLECKFLMNGENGATFFVENIQERDWSRYIALGMDIYNRSPEYVQLVMSVSTGEKWLWQESYVIPVEPGTTRDIRFNLKEHTFKSELTDWKNVSELLDIYDVRRVAFKFFAPKGTESTIYIDNLRFVVPDEK